MPSFRNSLERFSSALNKIDDFKVKKASITDFDNKKRAFQLNFFDSSFNELISSVKALDNASELQPKLDELKAAYKNKDIENLKKITNALLTFELPAEKPTPLSFKIPNIPSDIIDDMKADLLDLEKCFRADCLRASIILCGRLLETALHRKYFEATSNDLLEKSPGIGLGNIIAKLKEKNIPLDPAITQQIHLINQIRIYSVHKKKEAFYPTKDQTHAIILYTIDVIKRLFSP